MFKIPGLVGDFINSSPTPCACLTATPQATVSAPSSWTTLGLVESVGAVSPASTSQICGPRQTGAAPSCRRLTNTSQPGRIIRSRLGSAQPRLRPCCWTRRNVSDLCTVRQRVSWSVSRLSSGPPAPGTLGRHGNHLPPPRTSVNLIYLILSRHFAVDLVKIITNKKI